MDTIKHSNIDNFCINCINNYFIVTAVIGICLMISIPFFNGLLLWMLLISAIILALKNLSRGPLIIDGAIFVTIIIILSTSLFNNYPFSLYRTGVRDEILPMFFFPLGRSLYMANNKLFEKAILPVFLVGLIGLYLFIIQPTWYVEYRMSDQGAFSDERLLEMTRLAAFWKFPYWVSYGSAIVYYYLLCKFVKNKSIKPLRWFPYMAFILIILILTQQRGPIGFAILVTILVFFVSLRHKSDYKGSYLLSLMLIGFLFLAGIIGMSFMSTELIEFMTKKMTVLFDNSNGSSFIGERADIFYQFANKEVTIWGDGIGRFSHQAISLKLPAISDQQYMKMLYETGFLGLISRLSIICIILFNGIKHLSKYYFEVGIIIMFLITMMGANSLSILDAHCYIFWLCCGRIYNKNKIEWV